MRLNKNVPNYTSKYSWLYSINSLFT